MASHPLNLALRFLLELAALFALGLWGWTRYILVLIHYLSSYDRVSWLLSH